MCEHALEAWRRKVERESFNSQILREIQELKVKLERKIVDLRIQGNHHEADRSLKLLAWLVKAEESMRKMLNKENV